MKKTSFPTVACYVRVSTVSQNEAGQRAEIDRWITSQGLADVSWYVDKVSGSTTDRPALQQLQQDIQQGHIKTVVVYKLDRLSRSMRDGVDLLCRWCDMGLRVVAVSQAIDFSGTLGKMLAAVLLGVSEMELELRKERQVAGIRVAKELGIYKGRQKGTTKAMPTRARQLRAKGNNDSEIAKSLGVSRRTVQRYLNGAV